MRRVVVVRGRGKADTVRKLLFRWLWGQLPLLVRERLMGWLLGLREQLGVVE